MVKDTSYMFVTGPDVVKTVTNEVVTKEELGGSKTHTEVSGVAHLAFEDEIELLKQTREFYNFLPLNSLDKVPILETSDVRDRNCDALNHIVPTNPNSPYDMKKIINTIVDENYFFETMTGLNFLI
jgi:propionyl-CoA carboxylase beta chain